METDRILDDDIPRWKPSASVEHHPEPRKTHVQKPRATKKRGRALRNVVQDEEDEDDADVDEDYVESADEYEDEGTIAGADPVADDGGAASVDEEEDELMMGMEVRWSSSQSLTFPIH